jgi:hypothetical protein
LSVLSRLLEFHREQHEGKSVSNIVINFESHLDCGNVCMPFLPLTHVTRPDIFMELVESQTLTITKCKVYEEELLYFFYGRPAYRPFRGVQSTSQPGFRPVCILLNPDAIADITRMVPFDSGAFSKELYSQHIPPYMNLTNFEFHGGIEQAAKFVAAFFGTNLAYYLGRIRTDLKLSPTDFIGHAYSSILCDRSVTNFDDRRGTIEIHSSKNVLLTRESVKAVSLPYEFLEDFKLRSRLLNDWECDVIPYDVYHDQPTHDIREVTSRVKDYLVKEGIL